MSPRRTVTRGSPSTSRPEPIGGHPQVGLRRRSVGAGRFARSHAPGRWPPCASPWCRAGPTPSGTASPTTSATSPPPCATPARRSSRSRSSGRGRPPSGCSALSPTSCTSSSRRRRSASPRAPACCPTWCAACRSSPPCTSTAGGPRRAGCPAACGGRWSAPGCGTARRGGSSRAAAPCSPRTPATPASLQERFGRTAVQVPLAPNVPDLGTRPTATETRRRLGVPADAQVVAFFGFVHPVKGLRYLIEALARLRGAGRDRLHLLILGGFTSLALPEHEARAFREELTAWTQTCGVARARHDHRAPAGRGGLGRAARRRPRRLPVHRRRHDEERRAALGLRARPAHPRHRGGPARSRPRRRHVRRRRPRRPRRARAGRRPGPAARRRAAAS